MPSHSFRRLLRVSGKGARVGGLAFDESFQISHDPGLRAGYTFQRAWWTEPESQFGAGLYFWDCVSRGFR